MSSSAMDQISSQPPLGYVRTLCQHLLQTLTHTRMHASKTELEVLFMKGYVLI